MSTITIRLNADDERLFKNYAEFANVNLSTLFKDTLREYIEEQYDAELIADYEQSKKDGTLETVSHDEFWEGLV